MKTVQLTPYVRYASLNDEEGTLGLFIVHMNGEVYRTYEVSDREEFKRVYDDLVTLYGTEALVA